MLSESAKESFRAAVDSDRARCLEEGPVGTVEKIIETGDRFRRMFANDPGIVAEIDMGLKELRENRKEAEQYVAGLLGMM